MARESKKKVQKLEGNKEDGKKPKTPKKASGIKNIKLNKGMVKTKLLITMAKLL